MAHIGEKPVLGLIKFPYLFFLRLLLQDIFLGRIFAIVNNNRKDKMYDDKNE